MTKPLVAFGWFGGKVYQLNFILPNLPRCLHYCEPFGGAATVLLNRERSTIETYNDLDGNLVNLFKVIRDRPDDLQEKLALTLYSREEYDRAAEPCDDELERARRFYVRIKQVFGNKVTEDSWSHAVTKDRGAVTGWANKIDLIPDISSRLRHVQIEHDNAVKVIARYDSPDTLFYCDPPYTYDLTKNPIRRDYESHYSAADAAALAEWLHTIKGLVAISGYAGFYDKLYFDWRKLENKLMPSRISNTATMRQEILWCNYGEDGKRL